MPPARNVPTPAAPAPVHPTLVCCTHPTLVCSSWFVLVVMAAARGSSVPGAFEKAKLDTVRLEALANPHRGPGRGGGDAERKTAGDADTGSAVSHVYQVRPRSYAYAYVHEHTTCTSSYPHMLTSLRLVMLRAVHVARTVNMHLGAPQQ